MTDSGEDMQWSDGARERYVRRAEELMTALKAHVALTLERSGRQRELESYFASCEAVGEAAEAFNEAEFEWCGSSPLRLMDEDLEDFEDDEEGEESGSVLSALVRWDFEVVDEAAVIAAGRDAYRGAWASDTEEDAVLAVPDVVRAASELVHGVGWSGLENAPGLERRREWWTFVSHDGQSGGSDDEDPFAIART